VIAGRNNVRENFEAGFMPCGSKVERIQFSNQSVYSDDIQEIEKISNTQ
jgi:hypothetical protein